MDSTTTSTFAEFLSPERVALTTAVRHLIDAVLTSEHATEDSLRETGLLIEQAVKRLAGSLPSERGSRRTRIEQTHGDYLARSPVLGVVSPLAPPLQSAWDGEFLELTGQFPTACEGPPGFVHGGWIAMAFDEALGFAAVASGHPGMTGKLSVKYRKPTPVITPISIRAWLHGANGRVATMRCELLVDGVVTAEGEGLFIEIGEELARQYFGDA